MTFPPSLAATLVLVTVANLLLRRGMSRLSATDARGLVVEAIRSPIVVLGAALYGFSMVAWLVTLRSMPVSRAYPIYVGGSFVLVLMGSRTFLHEHVGRRRIVGAAVILAGILFEVFG